MSFANDRDDKDDYDDTYRGGGEPHRGVLILVLGILGITMGCGVLSIVAWLMGKGDLEKIKAGLMDKEGEALTRVGYILGIVGTIMFLLGVLLFVLYIVVVAVFIAGK